VLIAGFVIFVFSGFGSTQALGWLTSFTLLVATLTNLVLLPVLLLLMAGHRNVK
jgi:predicted RND superfamily exporter protein